MTEIDEFKPQLRAEAEAAADRIREMQARAAAQYREMRSNDAVFRVPEGVQAGSDPLHR
jgi:hypothetical protein